MRSRYAPRFSGAYAATRSTATPRSGRHWSVFHGRVWNTLQLSADFKVHGFCVPFVVVTRYADGKLGSLEFQHHPRYYFNWREDA
jgi:hypothetical protein